MSIEQEYTTGQRAAATLLILIRNMINRGEAFDQTHNARKLATDVVALIREDEDADSQPSTPTTSA